MKYINILSLISSLIILLATQTQANENYLPQQVHISYTGNPTEMMISWATLSDPNISEVKYSTTANYPDLTNKTSKNITKFVDDGPEKRVLYIHRVLLTNLEMGQKYIYICGSEQYGWTPPYQFTAMRNFSKSTDTYPKIIFYGDFGDVDSVSLSSIESQVETSDIDAVLHIGDFAYDLLGDNGLVGDKFMNGIEPIAAYVPYMTAVGNHEAGYNYSHYKNRFTMPNFTNNCGNMLYSWNIGPAHIISFSSEVYFKPRTRIVTTDIPPIQSQFNWLVDDLIKANLPENRIKQPWIITMAHRPLYCSNLGYDACTWEVNPMREGLLYDGKLRLGLEALFYNYQVDLELWGHEHTYERSYPLYQHTPYTKNVLTKNGTTYYYNSPVPVHILSGAPGNKEMIGAHPVFTNNNWSAFHSGGYGYSYMEIHNSTHLHLQYLNATTRDVIDDVWLIKQDI